MEKYDRDYAGPAITNSLAVRASNAASGIREAKHMIAGLADQICGPAPALVSAKGEASLASNASFAVEIEAAIETVDAARQSIENDVQRIRQRLGL